MRVYSIFDSIDGEVNYHGQGHPTTFIRLSGCSLRCSYCDTQYARNHESGEEMSVRQIVHQIIRGHRAYKVTITGGEPLEQRKELAELVQGLWHEHVFVTIETNGAHPIPSLPCTWVADYKLKSSGMQDQMNLDNFARLNPDSFIKFVVTNHKDYLEAKGVMEALRRQNRWMKFALSPVTLSTGSPALKPAELIRWMREDRLNSVLLNIQLHKLLDLSEDVPA